MKIQGIDHVEFHGSGTPLEAIDVLLEGERTTGRGAERLEHAVAALHDRIRDRKTVRRLSVDQDHGR